MPLRSITFLVYFFCSSAAATVWPMVGVICYIVLYHVFPETTWWGHSLRFLGIRYSLVCGICLLIGTALSLNRLRFGRQFMHPIEWGVLLVFLMMLLSMATGTAWDYRTDYVLDKMAKVILFAFMFSHVVINRQRLWQLTVLFALMALYLGHEAHNAPSGAFNQNRLDGIGGPDFRESAGLAIHLFALLPFAVLVFQKRAWHFKVLAFLAGGYALNAILLCRARSAFLAAIVAGVAALWYVPSRHRRWVFCVLVAGVLGGLQLSDNWFWDRMGTIFSSGENRDTSATGRLEIWAAAWQMIKDNPLGVGIGHFATQIGRYGGETVYRRDAHNSFVLCAGEMGIQGLLLYLTTIGLSWFTLGRVSRQVRSRLGDDDQFQMLVFANRLALIVYMVSSLFVSRLYVEGVWWFLLLPVCISRAVEFEIRVVTEPSAVSARDPWPAEALPIPTALAPSGMSASG